MRPPFPYYGGKIILAPSIVRLFPPHQHYVEPYCGSLAVLLAKPPSPHETVNDLDGALMAFWQVLRDRPGELERVCALTPHARAEHQLAYEPSPGDDLERARRVWVQLTQGRAGSRRRTGWRHYVDPAGTSSSMPGYLAGYVSRIAPCATRLAAVSLECKPALDMIAKYGSEPSALLYVDPPYLGSTRASSSGYQHEMRDEQAHRELAEALRSCTATVVLSGYPSDLYDAELYPGWHRLTTPASTGQGGTWANRTEALWSNRPLGTQASLFDGRASLFDGAAS